MRARYAEPVTDHEREGSAARRQTEERTERLLGPQREVTITDARAIRALAHDARQRVIEVLYGEQRPRTATELAAADRTQSERDELPPAGAGEVGRGRAVGRRRRCAQPALAGERHESADRHLPPRPGRGGPDGRSAPRWPPPTAARAPEAPEPGSGSGRWALASGELWLTSDQAERLSLWLENAILDEHEAGWRNEPAPDRVRMAFLWSLLPDPLPADDPDETPDPAAAPPEPAT